MIRLFFIIFFVLIISLIIRLIALIIRGNKSFRVKKAMRNTSTPNESASTKENKKIIDADYEEIQ